MINILDDQVFPVSIFIKRLSDDAIIPSKMISGDSGFDLYSVEDVVIEPYSRKLVHTGIALEIPQGYEGCIRPRSGNALKLGYTVLNTPGTIDSGYRGEVCVIIFNTNDFYLHINVHDRIAQLVIQKLPKVMFTEVDELDTNTARQFDGFGSTD